MRIKKLYFSLKEEMKKNKKEFLDINSIRVFLNDNKIFFEILNLIIFSLFTIFIWFTANNLIRTQNNIIQIENKPFVYIKSQYEWENNEERIINIYNRWWNIYNYSSIVFSELKITRSYDMKSFYFNLNFFDNSFWSDYDVWLLNTKSWYNNNLIYNKFHSTLPKTKEYYYPELNNYIRVQYDDIFWNKYTEYFNQYWDKLSSIEWEDVFNRLKSLDLIFLKDLEDFDINDSDNFLNKYIEKLNE